MESIPVRHIVCDSEAMEQSINQPRSTIRKRLPGKRSFTDALREKYCVYMYDHMNDDDHKFQFEHIHIVGIIRDKRTETELGHLRNVVLDSYSISHAGIPQGGLASLCPNVVDLDLALNHIDSWPEVLEILTQLPKLKFLNISRNKIKKNKDVLREWPKKLPCVENLVLNNTGISWAEVELLAAHFPTLQELHVCGNEHKNLSCRWQLFPQLECLYLTNNSITSWSEVSKLHPLTNLKSLILSQNPLQDVRYGSCCHSNDKDGSDVSSAPDCLRIVDDVISEACSQSERNGVNEMCWQIVDQLFDSVCNIVEGRPERSETKSQCQKNENYANGGCVGMSGTQGCPVCCGRGGGVQPFSKLHTLCLSGTALKDWACLQALAEFPRLSAVRITGIPLVADYKQDDRWMLYVASLPKVDTLNGSEVTSIERERAERFFVRHFLGVPESERPARFQELQKKHGNLRKLVEIDLGSRFEEWSILTFIFCGQKIFTEKVHVVGAVGKLRSYIANKIGIHPSLFRIFHQSRQLTSNGRLPNMEELFLDMLPMSRYDIVTGDEIYIDLKYQLPTQGYT